MYSLRDYQQESVAAVGNAFRRKFLAPIAVMPTGGGKTVIASHIMRSLDQRAWRILVLAHREELIKQMSNKLHDYGVQHGIIMSDWQPDRRHNVQVASVATMIRRLDRYEDFDLIVIDEAHRSGAPTYATIVNHYQQRARAAGKVCRLLGLTATPHRLDRKGLGVHCGGLFDLIIPTRTTRQLIDQGYLCKYRYFVADQIDTGGRKPNGADWTEAEAAAMVDKPKLIGSIVEHRAQYGEGRPSLVFAQNVAHAHHIADEFSASGRRAVAVSADSDKKLRGTVLDDLAAGQVDVVVNVGLWIEGMDCPAISYIALAAMTESLTRCLQSFGRGTRLCDGKIDLVAMDHANMYLTHGYPCIYRKWSLDGKMPSEDQEEASYSVKRCPECGALNTSFTKICDGVRLDGSVCGARFAKRHIPEPVREAEGQLSEADLQAVIESERRAQELREARSVEDLKELAARRGYDAGYAGHVTEARERKKGLQRRLADLRILQGDPVTGIQQMKPKALEAEITERLVRQAAIDEAEIC